jgi:hypothetical protein
MKRKIFTLLMCAAAFASVSAQFSTMTIKPATKAATCDGVIDSKDPWVEADWVAAAVGKTSNVGDMSAKFQLKYDKDNLYFGVVVQDGDRFTGNSTTYTNDCVEFFISMDTTAWPTGTYHPDLSTKQLRLQAVADPAATGGAIECGQTAPANGQYVCVDNGTNYVQEWSMPWAELSADMDPAWDQKQFRFDIQVANATGDGLRTQQMFWDNASDDQWRNTTRMGIVTLATPIPDLGGGYVNDAAKMYIQVASKPVVADGIIDANDPWMADQWVVPAIGKTSNVGDMSAKFQLLYDKTNIYFGIVVQDGDRFTGNSTTYTNDCVEFFISMDTTAYPTGTYHPDLSTKQLRLQAVADPAATGGAIECGQTAPANGQYVCVDNGTNYVQEWVMPWAELSADMDPAWDQQQFRFDVQVANATGDGLRTQQMFWDNSSDDQWRNTTKMGVVALKVPLPNLPGGNAVNNVKSSKSLIYVSDNQLRGVKGLVSIYDVTGKLVMKSLAQNGSVNVASLKQGIYIVNSNNSAAKISIR